MFVIIAIFLVGIVVASYWAIFEQQGYSGWYALVPGYNEFILYDIFWERTYFAISFLASLCVSIFKIVEDVPLISLIVIVAALVKTAMTFILYCRMASEYNKNILFAIGLLFFPFIFFPLLAFSNN